MHKLRLRLKEIRIHESKNVPQTLSVISTPYSHELQDNQPSMLNFNNIESQKGNKSLSDTYHEKTVS